MTDNVAAWWARRQFSKGAVVPYDVGEYREQWQQFPALIRQYHPDLNDFITLTQIPPAADVYLTWLCDVGHVFVATPDEQRNRPGRTRRRSSWCPECSAGATRQRVRDARAQADPPTALALPGAGEAFHSAAAPRPASAAEARLRQLLAERLEFDASVNAVRVARPFFGRLEVWPDILLPDLRVAIEYDTVGRFGLEHVGRREVADRRKDRLLRAAGWEVVRIRAGKLLPLGPYDLAASAVAPKLVDRLIDTLRAIRGDLIVNAYLDARRSASGAE
ncbi:zinc-ribbon domain-containing protein [Subtercola endophyticus]|uniref:zinc-ribbon domain-containing protein n=1 Tax=Subtercola endophyticus TaxID=2895559 RepID=UPI001E64D326|nr:zinc-ribbon domain-containing protein [Subtercola endophyticus]UFS59044.1 zinc-ribbon domain-containing protein [Subtercola endophyticus]